MLRRSLGAGLGLLLPGCASYPVFHGLPEGPGKVTEDDLGPCQRWALLSDPHVSDDPDAAVGPVNMAAHLRIAVADVLARSAASCEGAPAPLSGVIVNGDCAFQYGRPGDYTTFTDLLVRPVCGAGIPLHLTLGNHDHRGHFQDALSAYACPSDDDARAVDGRLVSVIPGQFANFFLLDTLDDRYLLAGEMGRQQLDWLAGALARFNDRPAIVIGHHPIDPERDLLGQNINLLDAQSLWDVLKQSPHVKAYIFGHTHRWDVAKRDGIFLVNLPSTAYTFDAGQPQGWVEMWLGAGGARLRLHHIDATHLGAAEDATLRWA